MESPRVALITSSELRHRFYAARVAATSRLVGVVAEKKRAQVDEAAVTPVIEEHFAARDSKERLFFERSPEIESLGCPVYRTSWGGSNTRDACDWISALRPDYLVVYGTGIIKDPTLSTFDGRIVNLHLGLSPYYKGAGTNFWPLAKGEPECVGATFHILTREVDAGPVLFQVRPDMEPGDDAHDIGFNVVRKAAGAFGKVLHDFFRGGVRAEPQKDGGRVWSKKDFNEAAVLDMRRNFAEGMIPRYLADRARRDAAFPIKEAR
jgi:phosphoribosylglycinamide formyltransferase 1